jgi:hypothetical protein
MTKPWKEFRPEIVRLYIQEGRTLRDVQEIMKREHNFSASIRSYRQQFDHWRVGKYKCKRKSRPVEYSATTGQPTSPPITLILPPMSSSAYEQRPYLGPVSIENMDDGSWPNSGLSHYAERGHHHIKRESIPLPLYAQQAPVAPYRSTHASYRPYQAPRTAARFPVSPPENQVSSAWLPGRDQFSAGTTRSGASLYSPPRDPSPSMLARGQSSSYSDGTAAYSDDVDWVVPKSEPYATSDSDGSLQGEPLYDSRRRVHVDVVSSSRSTACSRGCSSINCYCDRVNDYYRSG